MIIPGKLMDKGLFSRGSAHGYRQNWNIVFVLGRVSHQSDLYTVYCFNTRIVYRVSMIYLFDLI